ncbi:hypothetical protein [Streptomyces sp. Tu6071]|uniref:hypothetical protein n=1 Tax=Streptomyces sp. Tu6071 TaxID=355249 RepID=UPI00131A216E|nr:hypothetical protein [Streptomyces sp. Tu6071]
MSIFQPHADAWLAGAGAGAGAETVLATTFLACPTVMRQVAKRQASLHRYQARSWIAGHKHVALAMFGLPVLAVAADDTRMTKPSRDAPSIEAIR